MAEVFPEGESPKHVASHTRSLREALYLMQDSVPCVLDRQMRVYPQSETFFKNNMSLINLPSEVRRGTVKRVFTIANGDYQDFVDYRQRPKDVVENWAHNLVARPDPDTGSTQPSFMYGVFYPSENWDGACGRARQGAYYKEDGQIFVVPFIQSYESLVVEYRGKKQNWSDTDLLDDEIWTFERVSTLVKYVTWQHEMSYGCDSEAARMAEYNFRESLSDRIHDCEQEKNGDPEQVRYLDRPLSSRESTNDGASDDTEVEFMALGDMGSDTEDTKDVAELVNQFAPDNILLLGDLDYNGGAPEDFENVLLKYYGGRLADIIPVWGNHDLEFEHNGQWGGAMLELFPSIAAINSNKLYYNKVVGPVEFFVINSGYSDAEPREPDGITSGGTQGAWIQARLAASTATWKIVLVHRAPYTDDDSYDPGITTMRWPYLTWGADFVLSGHGHNYQRLTAGGLNYFVVGTGGVALRDFTSSRSAESQKQLKEHGALRIVANSSDIQFSFYSKAGEVLDNVLFEA